MKRLLVLLALSSIIVSCGSGNRGELIGVKQKKWFGENCIDKGTLQGYEEYGAKQFWSDVKSIIVDKKDPKSLKGYTQ